MPKISVIIPVYNMEEYLNQCLDSVINQTLEDIEILCINDGSSDNSENIIRKYCEQSSKVKLYNQENQGVSCARNKGINEASGEFVAFMDPDDYYLKNDTLEHLYNSAKKYDVLICGGSFSEDHGTWIRKEFQGIYTKYTFAEDKLMQFSEYQFDYGYHRFIYSLNMLKENDIYFPEYIRFQDPPFFVKAMATAQSFYALKEPTYCYRWGHQKLKWDERRTSDVLRGFIDNLRITNEYGLDELHRLTVWRLTSEYLQPIVSNLNSTQVLSLLFEANGLINSDYVQKDAALPSDVLPIFLKYFEEESVTEKSTVTKTVQIDKRALKVGKAVLYIPRKVKRGLKKIVK